jgi:GNAT superfamily N-acetyltransferase
VIHIRPFEQADQNIIPDFVVGIQRVEFGVDVTIAGQPDLVDISGYFRHGVGEFWVAVDGERIVGTIGLKDIGPGDCALRKMFVAASYRGQPHAIAQKLMETFNEHCRKVGVHRVMLGTTSKMAAAHRFYERNNFTRVELKDLPPHFPRMPVDDVFYRRYDKVRESKT